MSLRKLSVLPGPRFSHDHDVLKLQVVLEFGLLLGRDAAILGSFDQLSHALLDASGRMERDHGLGCSTSRDKIDDFLVRFGGLHRFFDKP